MTDKFVQVIPRKHFMMNEHITEPYPELLEYIFDYCGHFFWEEEMLAHKHLHAFFKSHKGTNTVMYKFFMEDENIKDHPEVMELVKDGFEAFKQRVALRIYQEHLGKIELNLCPRCGKIARTPRSKQCRFCYYDWHGK